MSKPSLLDKVSGKLKDWLVPEKKSVAVEKEVVDELINSRNFRRFLLNTVEFEKLDENTKEIIGTINTLSDLKETVLDPITNMQRSVTKAEKIYNFFNNGINEFVLKLTTMNTIGARYVDVDLIDNTLKWIHHFIRNWVVFPHKLKYNEFTLYRKWNLFIDNINTILIATWREFIPLGTIYTYVDDRLEEEREMRER